MDSILYPANGYETRVADDGVAAVDLEEVRREKDTLREEVDEIKACFEQREVEFFGEIHEVRNEVQVYRGKVVELQDENERLRACLEEKKVDFFKQVHQAGIEVEIYRERCKELEIENERIRCSFGEREHVFAKQIDEVRNDVEVYRERVKELESENERIRGCFEEQEHVFANQINELRNEIEVGKRRIRELEDQKRVKLWMFEKCLNSIQGMKECLMRVTEIIDEEKMGNVDERADNVGEGLVLDEELRAFSEGLSVIAKLVSTVETKVREFQEMRRKEKRDLENSVVSLTEENRDINSLLRIALVEKEAVEKSLSKLKGNTEQKRVPLLQFGLQRVGFGFMMGNATSEQSLESSEVSSASTKSDSSECEEEVASLASTVERIMKNLRAEISQLRQSLDDSRSDAERLQSLTEKQAQTIRENELYIKELEERERLLTENIEELLVDIKETEEEVIRWKEACELEVKAGKNIIEERDKMDFILQQELEKTKAALEISNSKLKLKEDLAAAAMAAQAAAERSLQLADSRASGLRERIEELTRQAEELESKERNRLKIRHICWPWRVLKMTNATEPRVHNVKRMLPEMQALLHYNVKGLWKKKHIYEL